LAALDDKVSSLSELIVRVIASLRAFRFLVAFKAYVAPAAAALATSASDYLIDVLVNSSFSKCIIIALQAFMAFTAQVAAAPAASAIDYLVDLLVNSSLRK